MSTPLKDIEKLTKSELVVRVHDLEAEVERLANEILRLRIARIKAAVAATTEEK